MNQQHLRAFFWLRWRLFVNQIKRGGIANGIILALLAAASVVSALVMFVSFFLVGLLLLPDASSMVILYVSDGLVVVFLFFWAIGIMTELQRSEALALDKFLHLPVSLTGAFFINYLSSLLSFTMLLFLPAMVGLGLGLVISRGPLMLLLFPLGAAFVLMLTALTYQLQGWLASLMANKSPPTNHHLDGYHEPSPVNPIAQPDQHTSPLARGSNVQGRRCRGTQGTASPNPRKPRRSRAASSTSPCRLAGCPWARRISRKGTFCPRWRGPWGLV